MKAVILLLYAENNSVSIDSIITFQYSPFELYAILAQLAERVTCNLEVLGSIPGDGSALHGADYYVWRDSRVVKGGRL